MFFFGIRTDGVREGQVCREATTWRSPEPAQEVRMRCGCIYIYVEGMRYGIARQCIEHEGEMAIVYATIINSALPCCRN